MADILAVVAGHFFFSADDCFTRFFGFQCFDVQASQEAVAFIQRKLSAQGAYRDYRIIVVGFGLQDVVCCSTYFCFQVGDLVVFANGLGSKLCELREAFEQGCEVEPESKGGAFGYVSLAEPFSICAITANKQPEFLENGRMAPNCSVGDPIASERKRGVRCKDGVVLPFRWKAREHRVERRND